MKIGGRSTIRFEVTYSMVPRMSPIGRSFLLTRFWLRPVAGLVFRRFRWLGKASLVLADLLWEVKLGFSIEQITLPKTFAIWFSDSITLWYISVAASSSHLEAFAATAPSSVIDVSVLCITDVGGVAIIELEANYLFENLLAAASVSESFAMCAVKVSPMTSLRNMYNFTSLTTV